MQLNLSLENLILLGHSFGGGSVMAALEKSPAKAVIGIDPWLFPVHKTDIKAGPTQNACVVMSELWEGGMKRWTNGACDSPVEIEKFSNKSANSLDYFVLLGLDHHNQSDMMILAPWEINLLETRTLVPPKDYIDWYLLNFWVGMRWIEQKNLCLHPEL